MKEKVDNYIEARYVIMDGVDSKFYKNRLKITRLRALFAATVAAAAAAAIGIFGNNPMLTIGALPVAECLVMPLIAPYIINSTVRRQVHNESYFNDKSAEEIINIANEHIREENEFEEKQQERGKSK